MAPTEPDAPTGCEAAAATALERPLLSERLKLRRLHLDDAPSLAAMANDLDVARFTARLPHPYGPEDGEAFVHEEAQARQAGAAFGFAIERTLDKAVLGIIGIEMPEDGSRRVELGYWLGRAHWRKGLATEAVRRLVRSVFQTGLADEIHAGVLPENAASLRVLEKTGFVSLGIGPSTQGGRCVGRIVDNLLLTRADWEARWAARPQVLVAAAALIDADGRVLMATRPPGKSMAGLWEFPGGKINPGETAEAALVRELAEELGIDVAESCLAPLTFASHDYDTFYLLMPLFAIRTWRGQVSAREGQGLRWVRSADMGSLPMPPADLPLIPMLRDWV